MSIEIKLPELGPGIEGGDVLSVLVKEGDAVAKDQGIIELETDKATVVIPSSHAGKVSKVHVRPSQALKIGEVVLTVEAAAGAAAPAKPAPAPAPKAEPAKTPAKPATAPQAAAPAPPKPTPAPAAPPKPAPAPAPAPVVARAPVAPPPPPAPAPEPESDGALVAAGPAVRRFAREVGVDLRRVAGSGPGGRIMREDVLEVVRQANVGQRVVPPSAAAMVAPDSAVEHDTWGKIRVERIPKIRKTIAAKMHESWTTAPRVTNFDDADVTELEKIRQSSKEDYAKKGIKLTALPFVLKAVAQALRDHPTVNAQIDMENERIVYKEYVNVGIAVDTERGLIVPSLRGVDKMSIPEIARSLAVISERVRTNDFTIDDLRGSTFTVSNLGAIGGTYSTPIINVPEVAILLVGRSRKLPVVVDDEVAVRLMMPLSLSYDHRLVDGAVAARFLNDVISYLAAPGRLLLAP